MPLPHGNHGRWKVDVLHLFSCCTSRQEHCECPQVAGVLWFLDLTSHPSRLFKCCSRLPSQEKTHGNYFPALCLTQPKEAMGGSWKAELQGLLSPLSPPYHTRGLAPVLYPDPGLCCSQELVCCCGVNLSCA